MKKVLIVDDDEPARKALLRALSTRERRVEFLAAENGRQATELLKKEPVCLVLTDLRMPEMDGFELVAWMQSHAPGVAVMAMTAYASTETTTRLEGAGDLECLTKPVDIDLVASRIADTISQSVEGRVYNLSLASFLQLIEMERKTCTLQVDAGGRAGALFLRRGELLHAESGDRKGDAAAMDILGWENARISIVGECPARERTIHAPLGFLIMEALRLSDERRIAKRMSTVPPRRATLAPKSVRASPEQPCLDVAAEGLVAVWMIGVDDGAITARSSDAHEVDATDLALGCAATMRAEEAAVRSFDADARIEDVVVTTHRRILLLRPLPSVGRVFLLLLWDRQSASLALVRFRAASVERMLAERRAAADADAVDTWESS